MSHTHGTHEHAHDHGHSHGLLDRSILRSRQGLLAVGWSLGVLGVTALLQAAIFVLSGSVALLADLVHNVGDALTAMLVGSANDACLALAEDAAGSVDRFVATLNERAARLGLRGTRYANPCGLPQAGHVTTARDLLRMAELAMSYPEFARRVGLVEARFRTLGGRALVTRTTNMLLGRFPGAVGVKTGYSRQAGKCLVALAERDGTRVAVVLLDAPDRWWTAAALLEEAFHVAALRR